MFVHVSDRMSGWMIFSYSSAASVCLSASVSLSLLESVGLTLSFGSDVFLVFLEICRNQSLFRILSVCHVLSVCLYLCVSVRLCLSVAA